MNNRDRFWRFANFEPVDRLPFWADWLGPWYRWRDEGLPVGAVIDDDRLKQWSLEYFGFDASFTGSGQQSLYVNKVWSDDKPVFGGDIRQTRLNFSVRGPAVFGGAVPKAVVEFDMFGSSEFQPTGSYGDVSIIPRIRVAYAELNWGNGSTIIQIGQPRGSITFPQADRACVAKSGVRTGAARTQPCAAPERRRPNPSRSAARAPAPACRSPPPA